VVALAEHDVTYVGLDVFESTHKSLKNVREDVEANVPEGAAESAPALRTGAEVMKADNDMVA
jgi:hypothetical protein